MSRAGTKTTIATWADRLGITQMLSALPQRRRLIVLNYHRIGNAAEAPYDRGTYSATLEDFDVQIAFLKKRIGVLSLGEALSWLERPTLRRGAGVLITFDDGYLDNYQLAFPVLRAHGVAATFFLTTFFVGTNQLPWWDRIADCVRRTQQQQIHLDDPVAFDFDLRTGTRDALTRLLLRIYKSPATVDPDRFVRAVAAACRVEPPPSPDRMFLDWREAAEMIAAGMSIGSHTHEHELLSKLSLEQQVHQLTSSRQILEAALPITVDVMAYPVGSRAEFSPTTVTALQRAGYRAAFSYYGGINRPGRTERFDIRRAPVDSDTTLPLFRLRRALSAVAGRELL